MQVLWKCKAGLGTLWWSCESCQQCASLRGSCARGGQYPPCHFSHMNRHTHTHTHTHTHIMNSALSTETLCRVWWQTHMSSNSQNSVKYSLLIQPLMHTPVSFRNCVRTNVYALGLSKRHVLWNPCICTHTRRSPLLFVWRHTCHHPWEITFSRWHAARLSLLTFYTPCVQHEIQHLAKLPLSLIVLQIPRCSSLRLPYDTAGRLC